MKKFLLFLCISLTFTPVFQSCQIFKPVQIVSPYSAALVADINTLGQQFDLFSATILNQADKSYESSIPDYNSMEGLAMSIKDRIEAMPKSGKMFEQAEIVYSTIIRYRDYHKVRLKLNDSEIRTNWNYFKGKLKPLRVSAMALK